MKPFTTIEIGGMVLGLVFVVLGVGMIMQPTEGVLYHPLAVSEGYRGIPRNTPPEYVTKRDSQIYGGIAVVLGVGIGTFALCRGKK